MGIVDTIFKNETNRFLFFQLAFLACFLFVMPILIQDLRDVVLDTKKLPYIGVLGIVAIVLDTFGVVIKSRELRASFDSSDNKLFSRFFVFGWLFRSVIYMFTASSVAVAFTGKSFTRIDYFIGILIFETLRWLVMGFIAYYTITEGKIRKLSLRTKFFGDIAILYSSLFFLSIMFYGMNLEKYNWHDMNFSDLFWYYMLGFFGFSFMYLPACIFQFSESLLKIKSSKDKWRFWLSLILTAILAVTYPLF